MNWFAGVYYDKEKLNPTDFSLWEIHVVASYGNNEGQHSVPHSESFLGRKPTNKYVK